MRRPPSRVTADVIASTPATNYAELLRSVPGVNLSQTSARDFNISMRGATSTLATSTLALLDGRSLHSISLASWPVLLPVNPNELGRFGPFVVRPRRYGCQRHERRGQIHFETPRELAE